MTDGGARHHNQGPSRGPLHTSLHTLFIHHWSGNISTMDSRKIIDILRGTIDPNLRQGAEEELSQVGRGEREGG